MVNCPFVVCGSGVAVGMILAGVAVDVCVAVGL